MGEFKQVAPLKCRTGVEAHVECAVIHKIHGKQFVVCNAPIFDYEQAVQLRDWLNAALGDRTLENEINDADRLITGLGLKVEECRTEGGSLNVARIVTKVSEMRVDKAIAERINAACAPPQESRSATKGEPQT